MSSKKIEDLQKAFTVSPEMTNDPAYLRKMLEAKDALINQLFKKIDELQDIDRSKVIKLNLTPEEQICELQIQSLLRTSQVRDLTLEETKKLDLLIKNKRLYSGQSTMNTDHTVLPSNTTSTNDDELLRIASGKEEPDTSGS